MNEVNTTILSERIKRLEHQNKLIKLTGIVVVLGMAFMLLVGAKNKVPKEIVAEKFRVVDTQGKTRAELFAGPEGPALGLLDKRGKTRVNLTVDPKGPVLALIDENRKVRANFAIVQGCPALALHDKRGKYRAILAVPQEGPGLSLVDKNGKKVFSAP